MDFREEVNEFIDNRCIYSIKSVAPTSAYILGIRTPRGCKSQPIMDIIEDLKVTGSLAIIVLDALGLYPWYFHRKIMPFLTSIINRRLAIVKSIVPSKTPINFATIVSGVGLEIHGIYTFNDNFRCETLFDVIRENGLKSMGCGRPNTTGANLLARYADIKCISPEDSDDSLMLSLINYVLKYRPNYIIAQFIDPDNYFHRYGPYSDKVSKVLNKVDMRLKNIVKVLNKYYSILILADHGQHAIIDKNGEVKGGHGESIEEDVLVPLTWISVNSINF